MLVFDIPGNAPVALQVRIPAGMSWYALHEINAEDNYAYSLSRAIISRMAPSHLEEIYGGNFDGLNATSSYLLAYGQL